ncbi:MAG: polysaccharide deacetylase family protein [Deltaproteobacteria bacterium]|nr:polysaccharide deacetylase family protein [Deltaproteobacteria bacterium]
MSSALARPRALAALALTLVLAPLVAGATGDLDEVDHKVKPADGNLWSSRYGHGRMIDGHCPPRRRCVAFTFDDGPSWETTPRLLDELDRRGLPATFFVTGHRLDGRGEVARRNREVLQRTWARGYLVGNHTYNHDLLDTMNEAQLRFELDRTSALIEEALGTRVWLFRAPFGALHHPTAVRAVFSRGYTPVFWGMDSNDWRVNTPEGVLANVRAELERSPRGGVLLMHDTLPWSVAAFPLIVDELERRSAELVARGEQPYQVVSMEAFWQPLRTAPAPSRPPRPRRPRRRG